MGTPYTDGFGTLYGGDTLTFTPTNASLNSFSPLVTFSLDRGIQALNVRFMYSGATILFNETVRGEVQFWYDGPIISSAATQSTSAGQMAYMVGRDASISAHTITFNWDGSEDYQVEFDAPFSPVNRLSFTGVTNGLAFVAPQNIGIQIYADHHGAEGSQNKRFMAQIQASTVRLP